MDFIPLQEYPSVLILPDNIPSTIETFQGNILNSDSQLYNNFQRKLESQNLRQQFW